MPSPRRARALVLLAAAILAACGGDDGDQPSRVEQLRDAARRAGLGDEVADVFALAAQADEARFQVTYAGEDGSRIVVSQAPPDRRVDVVQGEAVVSSRVLRDGVGYRCERDDDGLACRRAAGVLQELGGFTDEALQGFVDAVTASAADLAITVDRRTIADTEATCVTTTPKAGTPLDGTGPGTDVLCLSEEGAQLLVDHDGERLVADRYSTTVPEGTFDVRSAR